jgi:cobyrinic acid a,c-diamide synthase
MRTIGVASPVTGSGKTTVSAALAYSLHNSIPIKIGPDYIDPAILSIASGEMALNLDRWVQGRNYMKYLGDVSGRYEWGIFEGVMGLHDSGSPIDVSTYYYLKHFRIPYLLVIDVSRMAESAYYSARGFLSPLSIGVIINNYYSDRHLQIVSKEFLSHGIRIVGAIPHDPSLSLEERHLGLRNDVRPERVREIAARVSSHLDLDHIKERAGEFKGEGTPMIRSHGEGLKVAIANDKAFNFYYRSSIDFFADTGRIEYFSPLGNEVPEDPDIIYIGGGYPEIYADRLQQNTRSMDFIRTSAENGTPVIAECGGLMYLQDSIEIDGKQYRMASVFRGNVKWSGKVKIAYTELQAVKDNLLFRKGETAYGHEFHYSTLETQETMTMKNIIGTGTDYYDGMYRYNTLASYSHFDLNRYGKRILRAAVKINKGK